MARFILALLEVDDDKMPDSSDFYGEMGWVAESGISIVDDIQLDSMPSDYAKNLFEAVKEHANAADYIFKNAEQSQSMMTPKNKIGCTI